jgi:hypothetical protein
MELEDFKNTWNEMSSQVKLKQNLNLKIFDTMSKRKFNSKLENIILPEILGSAVCIGSAVFTGFNFYRLDNIYFQVAGVLTILLFVVVTLVSLVSIRGLYKAGDIDKPYADTLKSLAIQKIKFYKLQKLNLILSYLMLVFIMMLSTRLFGRNEITDSRYFWIFSISIGYIVLVFFSKWVTKKYKNTIRQTEELLHELSA